MNGYVQIQEIDIPKCVRWEVESESVAYGYYCVVKPLIGAPFKRISHPNGQNTYYASQFEYEAMSNTFGT